MMKAKVDDKSDEHMALEEISEDKGFQQIKGTFAYYPHKIRLNSCLCCCIISCCNLMSYHIS